MSHAIDFFCGISHKFWNGHKADPGPYACISPIVGHGHGQFQPTPVHVPDSCRVLQDSGAYGEPLSRFNKRLTFANALKRQEQHAERYDYADKIAYRASYDLLIDHRLANRQIVRADEIAGVEAVDYTVRAAKFLAKHRNGVPLALNAQGSIPEQYFHCVQQIVPLLHSDDVLGLGGFCILGRMPSLMSDFLETLALVIPFIAKEGVRSVHLYGCTFFPALAACLSICDHHNIKMSVDSAFPSFAPRIGKWGYGSWRWNAYKRPPVLPSCKTESCSPDTRCLGLECIRHIQETREWLGDFRNRERETYSLYSRNLDQYQYGQILDLEVC